MAASQIVWTPLPNGHGDGRLRLSVLVAPRLAGATTLAGFPEWLAWPQVRPAFSVTFQGGAKAPATIAGPPPRLDLWQRLFTRDTPVAAPPAPVAAAAGASPVPPIRSWPHRTARALARAEHVSAMAYAPTAPRTVNDHFPQGSVSARRNGEEGPSVTDIYLSSERREKAAEAIDTAIREKGYFLGGALPGFSATEIDFLLAELFHERPRNASVAPRTRTLADHVRLIAADGDLDFHSALGSLAQYPALQRALGLVIDLTVDPAAIGVPIPSDPVTLSIEAQWPGTATYTPVYPVVAATLTTTVFQAKPSGTTQKDGFLALDTDQFGVMEVEADSAARLLASLSQTLNTRRTRNSGGLAAAGDAPPPRAGDLPLDPGEDAAPLPALRSSGLSVFQANRAKALHERLTASTARAANLTRLAQDPFHAEDLTYGIRVDVWDDTTKRWYSLCRRKGAYDAAGTAFTADDEGAVHLAHAQRPGDPTIYLHESLFSWSGYSLVANRPGARKEIVDGKEVTVGPDSEPTGPVKLKTSFRATGLPKLRYGRGYRFRARVVDIAGNGPGPDDPATAPSSPLVTYLRFEAVTSPLLLPAAPRTPAETVQHMVIRGDHDAPATGDCQRHAVPPRMSQLMAEQHGLYDVRPSPLNPGGIDTLAYDEIVRRDRGTLATGGKSDPEGWGHVRYYEDPVLSVPYLPDVLARGVVFRGLPGMGADEPFPVEFGPGPPRAFRIRLVNGTGKPVYDGVTRTLTVRLPPGRTADVRYASQIRDADLGVLGIWTWFTGSGRQPGGGLSVADLRRYATEGRLWQLTPARTLTLTHAVARPMAPPAFAKPAAARRPGETTAKFLDTLTLDRASTDHVDIVVSWTQPIDDPADPEPTVRQGHGLVARLTAPEHAPEGDRITLQDRHEFNDTVHRLVTLSASSASRFVDFFRRRATVTLSGTAKVTLTGAGIAPGTLRVTDPENGRDYAQDHGDAGSITGDYVVDVVAGTLARAEKGSAIPDGAAVDVSFVAGSVTRSSTEAQQPVVVNVRSSARPAVPDVAYLVPTFGWERAAGEAVTSTRRGNGLRVYLRRPWYSSGDGEVLGVVLAEAGGEPPARLRQYVTLRGQDPLFASAPASIAPGTAEFPLAVHPKKGYRLAEAETVPGLPTVAVAPHAVGYDKERRLWYCDITLTQDRAYAPFVRLALARLQPDSLSGLELSPVVHAQFAQLNPDRTLSVVTDPADATLLHVAVSGATYTAAADRTAEVKAELQVADRAPAGAVGWTTVARTGLTRSEGQWKGDLRAPGPRGARPMRLVVEERERPSDGGTRLVYVDAVEI
ncbi:hypothetical protein [Actinomadura roseirufa]|uniref:hypothetical protein n=1 Tax=Actinomadura roseirufa TaxID=2094049 RepID=UPI001040FF5C|nr:hypothetical protein [Actinomadura roseirufa]